MEMAQCWRRYPAATEIQSLVQADGGGGADATQAQHGTVRVEALEADLAPAQLERPPSVRKVDNFTTCRSFTAGEAPQPIQQGRSPPCWICRRPSSRSSTPRKLTSGSPTSNSTARLPSVINRGPPNSEPGVETVRVVEPLFPLVDPPLHLTPRSFAKRHFASRGPISQTAKEVIETADRELREELASGAPTDNPTISELHLPWTQANRLSYWHEDLR